MAELGEGVTLLSWRVRKNGLQKRGKTTREGKALLRLVDMESK